MRLAVRARGLAQIHAADVHPLLVPRVRKHLQIDAGLNDLAVQRWIKVDTSAYPTALRIYAACEKLPAFAGAHPLKQPGAPVS